MPTLSEWNKKLDDCVREMEARLDAEAEMAKKRADKRAEKYRKYLKEPVKYLALAALAGVIAWAIEFFMNLLVERL